MIRRFCVSGLASVLGLGMLTGCPEQQDEPREIDAAMTAKEAADNYQALSDNFAEGLSFLKNAEMVPREDDTCEPGGSACSGSSAGIDDLDEGSQALSDSLREHLLDMSHHRADLSTATHPVFCFKSDVCEETDSLGRTTVDPDCARLLEEVPVCVRFFSFEEGKLDGELLLGKSQEHNPLDFHLTESRVAVEWDLGHFKAAYEAIAKALGEEIDEEFPKHMAGVLGGEMVKVSPKAFTSKLSVLQPVELDFYDASDARRSEVRIQTAVDAFVAMFDAERKRAELKVDVKAVDLKLAADLLYGGSSTDCTLNEQGTEVCNSVTKSYTGTFLAHLGGASFTSVFEDTADAETFTVSNIGLGDDTSRLFFENAGLRNEILSVDMNPNVGRRVSLTLTKHADGLQLTATPSLDLLINQDLRSLASQFDDITGWALRAVTQIQLTGTNPSILFRDDAANGASRGVKVLSGAFLLKATGLIDKPDLLVEASAEQCVSESAETKVESEHPFQYLSAGVCVP